jgi:hypothetical protein
MTRRSTGTADRPETAATEHPRSGQDDYDVAPGLGAVDELDPLDDDESGITIGIVPHPNLARRSRRPRAPHVRGAGGTSRKSDQTSPGP